MIPRSSAMSRLTDRFERSVLVLRAPRVKIVLWGSNDAEAMYRIFTARHARFKVTQSKRWGVALLRLPRSFDEYLAGGSKEYLRRQRRRALRAGYRYAVVSPEDHLDEIVEINQSAPMRQGRAMPASYVQADRVAKRFEGRTTVDGILDASGRLRAYTDAPAIGDVFVFSLILGHADDLEQGIMYLLVSEVIRRYMEVRAADGSPAWAMYDTMWGASKGLAYFKERLGFQPYTVEWAWVETSGATPDASGAVRAREASEDDAHRK